MTVQSISRQTGQVKLYVLNPLLSLKLFQEHFWLICALTNVSVRRNFNYLLHSLYISNSIRVVLSNLHLLSPKKLKTLALNLDCRLKFFPIISLDFYVLCCLKRLTKFLYRSFMRKNILNWLMNFQIIYLSINKGKL